MRVRGGWRNILIQVSAAMMDGIASGQAGGARHGAGWLLPVTGREAGGGLKLTPSNQRMHATRDTMDVMVPREMRAGA